MNPSCSQKNTAYIIILQYFNIHFKIILQSTPIILKFLSCLLIKFCLHLSSLTHPTFPAYPMDFDFLILQIFFRIKIKKLHYMSFSPHHVTSTFLSPNIFFSIMFSNTFIIKFCTDSNKHLSANINST